MLGKGSFALSQLISGAFLLQQTSELCNISLVGMPDECLERRNLPRIYLLISFYFFPLSLSQSGKFPMQETPLGRSLGELPLSAHASPEAVQLKSKEINNFRKKKTEFPVAEALNACKRGLMNIQKQVAYCSLPVAELMYVARLQQYPLSAHNILLSFRVFMWVCLAASVLYLSIFLSEMVCWKQSR